jgi:hypothetical protein
MADKKKSLKIEPRAMSEPIGLMAGSMLDLLKEQDRLVEELRILRHELYLLGTRIDGVLDKYPLDKEGERESASRDERGSRGGG